MKHITMRALALASLLVCGLGAAWAQGPTDPNGNKNKEPDDKTGEVPAVELYCDELKWKDKLADGWLAFWDPGDGKQPPQSLAAEVRLPEDARPWHGKVALLLSGDGGGVRLVKSDQTEIAPGSLFDAAELPLSFRIVGTYPSIHMRDLRLSALAYPEVPPNVPRKWSDDVALTVVGATELGARADGRPSLTNCNKTAWEAQLGRGLGRYDDFAAWQFTPPPEQRIGYGTGIAYEQCAQILPKDFNYGGYRPYISRSCEERTWNNGVLNTASVQSHQDTLPQNDDPLDAYGHPSHVWDDQTPDSDGYIFGLDVPSSEVGWGNTDALLRTRRLGFRICVAIEDTTTHLCRKVSRYVEFATPYSAERDRHHIDDDWNNVHGVATHWHRNDVDFDAFDNMLWYGRIILLEHLGKP